MEHRDDLTSLERKLVACAAAGKVADCAPTGTTGPFENINDWDKRKIRAKVLVALCTGENPDWSVHPRRGIRLHGACIEGRVDLSHAQMTQCPLAFETCEFEEGVVLNQAATTDLSFKSCTLPSLAGQDLNSSGSLRLLEGTTIGTVSLSGAEFRGNVELVGVHLSNPGGKALNADGMGATVVSLRRTHIRGEVTLMGAKLRGQLNCREETLLINPGGDALIADLMSAMSVSLNGTNVWGKVRLLGANLSSKLTCRNGTTLINPRGHAIGADGINARAVSLESVLVAGGVRLVGANLSGELGCSAGTTLTNPEGTALNANGMNAAAVALGGTLVNGGVSLIHANLVGPFNIQRGTTLANPRGYALNAERMKASDVLLDGPLVMGEANFTRANVESALRFREGTTLTNPQRTALNAEGCQVGGTLLFRLGGTADGEVNLANARVGALDDDLASWPDTYHLAGFSYNSLDGNHNVDRRLGWIGKSESFSPHVYSQLAEVYRRSGYEGRALKVAIKRENERTRQLRWWSPLRVWHHFLGLTVAHGYRPWQALLYLALFFIVGFISFSKSPAQEAMVHPSTNAKDPISAAACHKPYPCFSPPIYVLDLLLPIVDLHQERYWVPARSGSWGAWNQWLSSVLILFGWVLTTAVVAGIGSLWRRE